MTGEEGAADRDQPEQGTPVGRKRSGTPTRRQGRVISLGPGHLGSLMLGRKVQLTLGGGGRILCLALRNIQKEERRPLLLRAAILPAHPQVLRSPSPNRTHPSRTFCPQTTFVFSLFIQEMFHSLRPISPSKALGKISGLPFYFILKSEWLMGPARTGQPIRPPIGRESK